MPLLAQVDPVTYGPFINWWAPLPMLVVLLLWGRLLTWIDKDCGKAMLPREWVNLGLILAMVLAILLFFVVQGVWMALAAVVLVFLLSMTTYLVIRANKIGLKDLKEELLAEFRPRDKDHAPPGKQAKVKQLEGQVILVGRNGSHLTQPATEDPNRIGYDALQAATSDPVLKGAHTIEIVPGQGDAAGARYFVDGVAYDGARFDKATASAAIAYLRSIAGLDPNERRKPQTGSMKILDGQSKHDVRVATAGSSAGETARLELDVPKRYQLKVPEMGFTSDQIKQIEGSRDDGGVVLLAAPKGHGLRALQYAMVRVHDAFLSHILTIERDAPIDLEGITQNKLAAGASPAEEAKLTSWVTSQEPNVLLMGGLETPQAARSIAQYATGGKRAYIGLRAGTTLEAVEAWRKLVGDDELAMKNLMMVVAGRLFRRLCEATKLPYVPEEAKLRQLGMAGRVQELYRPNFGPIRDARGNEIPDTFCFGMGYQGRFGCYETLTLDSELRSAIRSNAPAATLRTLFRRQKGRYIQELALARVEAGDTSVEEFLRVLKPEAATPATTHSPPATKAGVR